MPHSAQEREEEQKDHISFPPSTILKRNSNDKLLQLGKSCCNFCADESLFFLCALLHFLPKATFVRSSIYWVEIAPSFVSFAVGWMDGCCYQSRFVVRSLLVRKVLYIHSGDFVQMLCIQSSSRRDHFRLFRFFPPEH